MGVMFKARIHIIFVIAFVLCGSSGEDGFELEPSDNRIVGGEKVDDIKNYPYMATLQNSNNHICGATILNSRWLLCAAHCGVKWANDTWVPKEVTNMTIIVGTLHIWNPDAGSQRRNVAQIVVHPRFVRPNLTNDIAVIEVTQSLNLTGRNAAPVRLTTTSNNEVDPVPKPVNLCVGLGWGYRRQSTHRLVPRKPQELSPELMKVYLYLVPMNECQKPASYPRLQKQNLCTSTEEGKDTCQGDSGGPLMCLGHQWGVTSWGDGCALTNSVSVYTRVDGYFDWIHKVTGRSGNLPEDRGIHYVARSASAGSKHNGYLAVVHALSVLFSCSLDGMVYGNSIK